MADIFISYARADRDRIAKLAAALEAEGHSVWWDLHIEGGSKFSNTIEAELEAARHVIVAWSEAALDSMWVADEAAVGRDARKLVPIAIDAVEPPIGFRQLHTIAFQSWRGAPEDEPFKALLRALAGEEKNTENGAPSKNEGVSLIVLPFRTISVDPVDEVLAIALNEDLTTQLARVKDYFVISRTTAAVFAAKGTSPKEIGREIGVTYVLEGSVRRSGENVRVSAQLVDAITGGCVAALSFDRGADELLDLQNDLITEIITHLGSEINLAEVRRLENRINVNPTAIEHFNCARAALADKGWNRFGLAAALSHLEQAMEQDPEYAPALGQAALLKALATVNHVFNDKLPKVKPEILEMAHKALAIDQQSSDVLGFAGCALCDVGEIDEGVRHLERAVELDPSNAQAHAAYGWASIMKGNVDEGIRRMSDAIRISPRQPGLAFWLFGLGSGMEQKGDIEGAKRTYERAIKIDPNFAAPFGQLAGILAGEGDMRRAAQMKKKAEEIQAGAQPPGPGYGAIGSGLTGSQQG